VAKNFRKLIMKLNRFENVDVLRGILIILIVSGHIHWTDYARSYLYAFHLTAFFIITGFFVAQSAGKYSFKEILVKRIQKILIPYWLAALIFFLWFNWQRIIEIGVLKSVYEYLKTMTFSSSYLLDFNGIAVYFWFLPLFFLFSVLLLLIYKYIPKYHIWILICCILLSPLLLNWSFANPSTMLKLPWSVDKLILVLPLGIFGHIFMKNIHILNNKKLIIFIIVLIISIPSGFLPFDLRTLSYKNIWSYYFFAINGFVMVYLISEFVYKKLGSENKLIKLLSFCGKNSLEVYLVHAFVIPEVLSITTIKNIDTQFSPTFNVVILVMTVAFSLVLVYLRENLSYLSKSINLKYGNSALKQNG
jgi:fucose 4-O-acetylase-like acetyltransferase